jgi:4-amino-4-deoxy-L-arabinose transferase-like glycosyltransferase
LNRTCASLKTLLLAGALLYLVVSLAVCVLRMGYPFELEWLEGASLDHTLRVISGQGLYQKPSLEFIPFIYTPLYYYVSAPFVKMMGPGFLPLRLLSFLLTLGSLYIIFLMVKRETNSLYFGAIASCIFAATFEISGAWFDLARVDSLFLFLMLASVYVIRFFPSRRGSVLAGLLVSLSFLTKQVALAVAIPLIVYSFAEDWRRCIFFVGTIGLVVAASTSVFNVASHGWYSYYVFELPAQHNILMPQLTRFWRHDIIRPLPIAGAVALFLILGRASTSGKKRDFFYLALSVGGVGAAWISRLHFGGYANVLLPAYAVLAILFGVGLHEAFAILGSEPPVHRRLSESFIYLLCLAQFASLVYNPTPLLPGEKDLRAGTEFVGTMSRIEGDILLPYHGFLPRLAGKKSCAHAMALFDVMRGDTGEFGAQLREEIAQAIRERRFAAIILDSEWCPEDLGEYYIDKGLVFEDKTVFWPVSGVKMRPEHIYVPRQKHRY